MTLNAKQKLLAEGKAKGLTDLQACQEAGYKAKTGQAASNQVKRMMKNDDFTEYLKSLQEDSRSDSVKTAQDVKEDLSELMDHAKSKRDIVGYVACANRLAKMDGHDKPEQHEVQVNDLRGIVAKARAKNAT